MDELKCFFDIHIANQYAGERGTSEKTGKPLSYKSSKFHRVVKNFMIQGGDITDGNGKGGDSIYGGSFEDENLELTHDEPYLLSMANRGPNTNRSQFFITTNEAPHLDGKHVVFGRVVSGLDTILKIERQEVDSKSRPLKDVIIRDCGRLTLKDIEQKRQIDPPESTRGKKRRLSTSSNLSDASHQSNNKSLSRSDSCSSSSSECDSHHESTTRYRRPSSRSQRNSSASSGKSSRSSRSTDSYSSGSSSSETHSSSCRRATDSPRRRKRSPSTSSESSFNSSSSRGRSRKRLRTNRRLESTRRIETKDQSPTMKDKIEEKDTFVSPHYKCSVKLDEIPEVPVNRFLLREPQTAKSRKRSRDSRSSERDSPDESIVPVDLSKFEDIPDEDAPEAAEEGESVPVSSSVTALRSQVKATEPFVSRSGRIMKGRGTFKFRTPSPDSNMRSSYQSRGSPNRSHRWSDSRSRQRDRPSHGYTNRGERRSRDRHRRRDRR